MNAVSSPHVPSSIPAASSVPPNPNAPMSSVLALVTSLIKTIPNEEFGVLARWMSDEANRRRDHVRGQLEPGQKVVWVNTTGKLTQGEVVELGSKNALIRSEHGGQLYVPLARLERADTAAARLSSLPPSIPPPIPSSLPPSERRTKRISRGPRASTTPTLPAKEKPSDKPGVRKVGKRNGKR